jgi:hypothetical protein
MTSSVEQFGGIPRQAFEPGVFGRKIARPGAAEVLDGTDKSADAASGRAPEPIEKTARQGKEAASPGLQSFDALRALQEQDFKERTRPAELTPEAVAERYGALEAVRAASSVPSQLSPEVERQVAELQRTDQEVRAHEQAHAAAGGQYAGQPSYTYETGPDGREYAVAGEVSIDTSPVADDPEATIAKMEQVKTAATAPVEPSAQDRRVAVAAEAERIQAAAELRRKEAEDGAGTGLNFVAGVAQFRDRPPGDVVDLVV